MTDGFAKDREVILLDNAGTSSSSGDAPTSVEGMAVNAIAFIKALGLSQVDLLGFSLGGLLAQELTLAAPKPHPGEDLQRSWSPARLLV